MTPSLILAALWVVVAALIALFLPVRWHWRAAQGLIVAGLPILGYVTFETGALAGALVLAAGASVLRWPLRWLGAALRRHLRPRRD